MGSVQNVGKVFPTAEGFSNYLEGIRFGSWRPRFITLHHTGIPDLKMWNGWQGRTSDEQWLRNLASYYGNQLGWRSAPQFFFTPKNYCVLSPPERRGTHSVAFNATSWGVEAVGDFNREPFEGVMRDRIVEGLACLHIALGSPPDFVKNVRGLHFHRDDPHTSKTCPGTKIHRGPLIDAIKDKIAAMSDGDHPEEEINENPNAERPEPPRAKVDSPTPEGTVNAPEGLNLREAASGKSTIITLLANGTKVAIVGEAMNGPTKWLRVWLRQGDKALVGWIAAQFVNKP